MAEQVQINSSMYFTPGSLSANPQLLLEVIKEKPIKKQKPAPRSSNGRTRPS